MSRLAFALAAAALAGCTSDPKPTQFQNKHNHVHDREGIKLEDIDLPGKKCHAGLTAHLAKKEGEDNELDVLFETIAETPEPVTIPLTAKVTGRVTRTGDDKAYTLEFKPAPKEERKTDPDGQCSRFSAEAKWMKPDDTLAVVVTVVIDGQDKKVAWTNFVPKKYEHKHD